MQYLNAFWVGGIICALAQILIDKTKLTAGRILVLFLLIGILLGALGLYEPLEKFAGAGATVPISGFGYSLAKGAIKAVSEKGFIGIFTGGLTATSGGITASIIFAYLIALLCKPKIKS